MKMIWEHRWFLAPVGLFILAGATVAYTHPYGDEILLFNGFRKEPFNSVFRFISWCGEPWIWVVSGLGAMLWRYRFMFVIALAGLLTPMVFFLKDKVGTDRPITWFHKNGRTNEVVRVPDEELNVGQTSFPSGHTMSAFGLATVLAFMAGKQSRKRMMALAGLASLVGVSRIFLVQHFLVDVLGGALLGLAVGSLAWGICHLPWLMRWQWLDKGLIYGPFTNQNAHSDRNT